MKKFILALAILGLFATTAEARWVTQVVPENYVVVRPYSCWTPYGWTTTTRQEIRTRWRQTYYWQPMIRFQLPIVIRSPIKLNPTYHW